MKIVKLASKILLIVLITAVSFVGIYVQKQNRMENVVKDYSWGMDIDGSRQIALKVSDEKETITRDSNGKVVKEEDKKEDGKYTTEDKPVNPDEVKTLENYNKSKTILEKRLKKFGVDDYTIKMDEESGKIIIEIPENEDTDHTVNNFSQKGKFEIVDSEDTEKVLMDNNDIKLSNVLYNTTTKGTVVYLNIEFTKEGKEKLKNISTEYKTNDKEESNDDENKSSEDEENKEEQKKVRLQIDGNEMITTSFDEVMENGSIQLSMGQASTEREKINENVKNTASIATILDTGDMPVKYETEENKYVSSDITMDMLTKLAIAEAIVLGIALLWLIIRHKKMGLLSALEYIGFISVYLLLIRYTNVTLTLEGIAAIAVIAVLNYVFNYMLAGKVRAVDEKEDKAKIFNKEYLAFCIKVIPIAILSVVFCFINWMPISSFGMTMFWGLTLMALYNITVGKNFLK